MRMIGGVVLGMLENGSARIVCNCFVFCVDWRCSG